MKKPDDNRHFVFGAIPMCANRLQAVGTNVTQTITFKQWLVMLVVRDMPQGCSLSHIALQHGSSHQNVKKLLQSLEEIGYVTLTESQEDKRSYAVFMTEQGKTDMERISEIGSVFVGEVFEGIDNSDIAAARRVIDRMLDNLDAMRDEVR